MSVETMLADFLRYETAHGRKVIISLPPEVNAEAFVSQALAGTPEAGRCAPKTPDGGSTPRRLRTGRRYGPAESFGLLAGCGGRAAAFPGRPFCAGRAGRLRGLRDACVASRHRAGARGLVTAERVSDHGRGHPYDPGVRLYFDGHRIIRDGLAVSDGLHTLKVYDHLPLDPYLVAAVSVRDSDPEAKVEVWTPWTFLNRANECFASLEPDAPRP